MNTIANAAPAPVEHPWPPLSTEEATAYRWAKIAELEQLDRVLSRTTKANTARGRLLAARKDLVTQLEAANAWIANRHGAAQHQAVGFAEPSQETPPGMRPLTNGEYLLHVRRVQAAGHTGAIPRPLVRA